MGYIGRKYIPDMYVRRVGSYWNTSKYAFKKNYTAERKV